jgi:hypothetical protein
MIARALSIRQPYAWLIIAGHKTIENRTWKTAYRGRLLIHAALETYPFEHPAYRSIKLPDRLDRGGIIGEVTLEDIVTESNDPWFTGPYGWILANPRALPFQPCPGRLRLWTPGG